MKMLIEQVNSTGLAVGQSLTLEVVGGRGLPGDAALSADVVAAIAAAEAPSAENPFVTQSAAETAITTQRVDYDALVAASLSI